MRPVIAGVVCVLAAGATPIARQAAPVAPDCQPAQQPVAAPASFLAHVEIARCHDLAWRLGEVGPAIDAAIARLRAEGGTAPVSVAATRGRPLLAGSEVPMPAKVRDEPAVYPEKAYVDGITGLVIVEAIVDRNGSVRQAKAAQSVKGLDDAAVKAVRRWKFAPSVQNGQTVEALLFLPVRFGSTRELSAADWLELARFYHSRGLMSHVAAALEVAQERARNDLERFGDVRRYVGSRSPGGSRPPTKTRDVRPQYPGPAQRSKVQGQVLLEILIDRFGDVGRVRVIKPVPMLDLAAEEAVRQWKFAPAQLDGQTVSTISTVVVTFNLR